MYLASVSFAGSQRWKNPFNTLTFKWASPFYVTHEVFLTKRTIENWVLETEKYLFEEVFPLSVWKVMYKITGQCGSRVLSDSGILSSKKNWLWNHVERRENLDMILTSTCKCCGKSVVTKRFMGILDDRTDAQKEEGQKYAKDMIPRFRQGELSKEFVETYPKQISGMIKEGVVTKDQVKKAKNVWRGDLKLGQID